MCKDMHAEAWVWRSEQLCKESVRSLMLGLEHAEQVPSHWAVSLSSIYVTLFCFETASDCNPGWPWWPSTQPLSAGITGVSSHSQFQNECVFLIRL